jgi:hypothetical protein
MGCCGHKKKPLGNIIFKPIDTKIEKCGNKELDEIFNEMVELLVNAENVRKQIAEKFKVMIIETGVCVLKRPSIERCISSFIVQVFVEIIKNASDEYEKLRKINFSTMIIYKSEYPFLSLNKTFLEELKNGFNINLDNNSELTPAKSAIADFTKTFLELGSWFANLKTQMSHLYQNSVNFINTVKKKTQSKGEDGITFVEGLAYLNIGEKNLIHMASVTQLITTWNNFMMDIANTVNTIANKFLTPRELLNLQRIAYDAVKNKKTSPKEIVFYYAMEEKSTSIYDWQENLIYREIDEEDELKF